MESTVFNANLVDNLFILCGPFTVNHAVHIKLSRVVVVVRGSKCYIVICETIREKILRIYLSYLSGNVDFFVVCAFQHGNHFLGNFLLHMFGAIID